MPRNGVSAGSADRESSSPGAITNESERILEERVKQLSVVAELGKDAHVGTSLQGIMDRAVRAVADTLHVEYAKILELVPDGDSVLLRAGVGWKEDLVGQAYVSTGLDSQAGYTLASAHPVIVEDMRAETRFSGPSLLHEHGVVSGLSVIIPGEGERPYGVFGAHTVDRRQFTPDDATFLQSVANVIAGAVSRARTEDALRNTKGLLEREVTERTRELRSAVQDLEAFNAMVAHDLRAPLRGVEQLARAVIEDYGDTLDEDGRRLLGTLHTSATRMRQLVDDLLMLARAGRDPLQMEDIDVTSLARERWRVIAAQDPDRDVEFRVEDELMAHADPRLLTVVLNNLLDNAWKFTRGVPHPLVEVGSTHLDVGGTAFYVHDNGAGFEPDRSEDLFHVFSRLHSPTQFEGTGVGLATVQRIIERHGGRVWGESEGPGEGATIYFRLLPAGLP